MSDFGKILIGAIIALAVLGGLTYAGCAGYPEYKVWSAGKDGEAELKKAEQNRQIKVLEAQAELDSAKLKAQSEVERARGVAEANKIVAEGLKGNEEYLRYLWIDKVAGGNVSREVIYVPTEANLPILEAGKR
jgi:regulator of protease activity HflC (stomatin/prohibitin superfamily)